MTERLKTGCDDDLKMMCSILAPNTAVLGIPEGGGCAEHLQITKESPLGEMTSSVTWRWPGRKFYEYLETL